MGVRHMDNRRFNKVLNQRNLYIRDSVYYFRYKQKWTTLKATTKAEAIKEKDQLLAQKKLGILTDISKDTKLVDMLKEYVKWIETSLDAGAEHKNGMAPDLIERKKLHLDIILQYFPNNIKINDPNINRYFGLALEEIRKQPGINGNKYLSDTTLDGYRTSLSGAFTWAIKDGMYDIKSNPVASTKKVKSLNPFDPNTSKNNKLWERSVFELALKECKNNKSDPEIWYPLIALGGYSGMRIGEIISLQWSDYDEDKSEIKVYKSRRSAGTGKGSEETTPKSQRGYRVFPVCPELKEILKEHKENHYSLVLNSGYIFSDDFPIIYNTRKKQKNELATRSINRKPIEHLRNKGIIPESYTFHGLRHHFASYWIDRGVPAMQVAEWVGDSVKTIEAVYVKPMQETTNHYAQKIISGEI